MAPKLYMIPGSPPARSVLLTAKALNLDLELKEVNLLKGEHLSPEYLKLNPQHTVPLLDDNGFILADSHAINAYLVGKYGKDDKLYPKDLQKRAIVDHRLHFDNGILFSRAGVILRSIIYENAKTIPKEKTDAVLETYKIVETFLTNSPWVAGDSLTIADFNIVATLTTANVVVPIEADKFPKIAAWLKKMEALPYYNVNKEGLEMISGYIKLKLAG